MRLITEKICNAFESYRPLKISNSETDGYNLWLFGNKIAKRQDGEIWITNAGWKSMTTKERLNGLSGVNITSKNGHWYLNGHAWNGEWVSISEWNGEVSTDMPSEVEFDLTSQWKGTYNEPVYSAFHTNDETQLGAVENTLNLADIPNRRMYSDTQGKYLPHHFIVVHPENLERAKSLIQ